MCAPIHLPLNLNTKLLTPLYDRDAYELNGSPGKIISFGNRVKACEYCDRQRLNPSKTECESCGATF